jgi:hypothetical protein
VVETMALTQLPPESNPLGTVGQCGSMTMLVPPSLATVLNVTDEVDPVGPAGPGVVTEVGDDTAEARDSDRAERDRPVWSKPKRSGT